MRALAVLALIACSSPKQELKPLSNEEYLAEGIPDPSHRWSTDELTTASGALGRIARAHPYALPPRSHPIFTRIVEPAPPDDPTTPIAARVKSRFDRYNALVVVQKLYATDLVVPPREAIDVFGALLADSAAFDKLGDEFIASFPPDDPKLANRREGFATFHDGVGEMLLGALMIADNTRVPEADRRAMLAHLQASMPSLLPNIPAARQAQLREYVDKLTSGPLGSDVAKLRTSLPSDHAR